MCPDAPHRESARIQNRSVQAAAANARGYDCQVARRFEFVPLWAAIPVFLVDAMRRVNCPQGGVVVERGIVEGFNNKAKLTMRKAYGFKTFENIQSDLFHQLGKFPEPESSHRFC